MIPVWHCNAQPGTQEVPEKGRDDPCSTEKAGHEICRALAGPCQPCATEGAYNNKKNPVIAIAERQASTDTILCAGFDQQSPKELVSRIPWRRTSSNPVLPVRYAPWGRVKGYLERKAFSAVAPTLWNTPPQTPSVLTCGENGTS